MVELNGSSVEHQEMETDVLVIGGGLAGCFAAIKAREAGANVLLFDKSVLKRSGNTAFGLDHFPGVAYPGLTIDPSERSSAAACSVRRVTGPSG
jgi:thioredoxin reductase